MIVFHKGKMGYKDEFYLTVKSTDSAEIYKDNTPMDFIVKLPYSLELGGDWAVGVNQIWIDKMWYNVKLSSFRLINTETNESLTDGAISIEEGYYSDIDQLLETLTKTTNIGDVQYCEFVYSKIKHKLTVTVKDKYVLNMEMSQRLCRMLGSETCILKGHTELGKCVNLHMYDGVIQVNTDMITGHIYANVRPSVIKTLSTNMYNFGDIIYDGNLNDHTKLYLNKFDSIRLQILDADDVIKQTYGVTVVQFHFKRQ